MIALFILGIVAVFLSIGSLAVRFASVANETS